MPDFGPDLGHALLDRRQHLRGELANTAVEGGVRAHAGEQQPLGSETLDVGAALAPASQQQEQMDHDLAPVVPREAPDGADDGVRDHSAQAQAVGEAAQGVKTRVRGDLVAARLHHDLGGAGSLHLRSALLVGVAGVLTTPVSLPRGHFCSYTPPRSSASVNDRG